VTQDDAFFAPLTVSEALGFTAKLKLPETVSAQQRAKLCDEVIEALDLHKCCNTRIGEVGAGISGGERRRLAIAMQIINEPSLLLLDEPTSGLDSASAMLVGNILRRIAETSQRTVIATIHQPRAGLLQCFDRICLLAEGKVIYFGPSIPTCLEFFEHAGFSCPKFENPADFMLDLVNTRLGSDRPSEDETSANTNAPGIGGDNDHKEDDDNSHLHTGELKRQMSVEQFESRSAIVKYLHEAYDSSKYKQYAVERVQDMPPSLQDSMSNQSPYVTGWWNQFTVVTSRSFLHKLREPMAAMTQVTSATLLPFIVGTIYWQLSLNAAAAYDRLSAVSFIALLQAFMAYDILVLFPLERKVYQREHQGGLYCTSSYYIGRTLAELPFHAGCAFLTALVSYWTMGFQNDIGKFFVYVLAIEMITITGSSMLLWIGSMAKDLAQSNILATFFIVIFMLFDGNWIAESNIPRVYRWIKYISFLGYGVETAAHNEFDGLTFDCPDPNQCPFRTGSEFLALVELDDVNVTQNLFILLAMTIVYRIMAYLGLKFMYHGKSFRELLRD
jgi:ABC-type multidrug transport system ATPase subunit